MRRVILVCGAPGAGKTTWARDTGLLVYDRDDALWDAGGEAAFRAALADVGRDPHAQAAVIRCAATVSARQQAAALVRATDIHVIDTPLTTCIQRIKERKRTTPPLRTQIAGAQSWWRDYEPDLEQPGLAPLTSREW